MARNIQINGTTVLTILEAGDLDCAYCDKPERPRCGIRKQRIDAQTAFAYGPDAHEDRRGWFLWVDCGGHLH